MFKKYILLISAMLSFGMIAQVEASGDASGFMGSFELKYRADLSDQGNLLSGFSYRARAGWAGEVNSMINWKLALSSDIQQRFGSFGLNSISLEQAYVSYSPIDAITIRVGKFGWVPSAPNFHEMGVLFDDDLYNEGAMASYNGNIDDLSFNVSALLVNLLPDYNGPFSVAPYAVLVLGVGSDMGDFAVDASIMGIHDGLLNDASQTDVSLVSASLKVSVANLGIPVGLSGNYSTNVANPFDSNHTYTGGAYVGANNGEMGDYMVAVNYYNVNATTWNADLVDTDYISKGVDGNGVAAKASYNLFDNSNIALKYNYNLNADSDPHNLVAELTFDF